MIYNIAYMLEIERYSGLRFTRDIYKGFKIPEVPARNELTPGIPVNIKPPETQTLLIKRQMKHIPISGK